jgi:hypothetical protein
MVKGFRELGAALTCAVQWHGWPKVKEEKGERTVHKFETNLADIADMHGGAESFHNFCWVEQQAHVRLIQNH